MKRSNRKIYSGVPGICFGKKEQNGYEPNRIPHARCTSWTNNQALYLVQQQYVVPGICLICLEFKQLVLPATMLTATYLVYAIPITIFKRSIRQSEQAWLLATASLCAFIASPNTSVSDWNIPVIIVIPWLVCINGFITFRTSFGVDSFTMSFGSLISAFCCATILKKKTN